MCVSTINSEQGVAFIFSVDQYLNLKMEAAGSSENLKTTNQTTECRMQGDCRLNRHVASKFKYDIYWKTERAEGGWN